jgi:hypothetical protein
MPITRITVFLEKTKRKILCVLLRRGPGVAQWLRHCATSRKVSGSIPGGVTLGIYLVATDGTMCPGVDSASKDEYQGFLLGVKAAGA